MVSTSKPIPAGDEVQPPHKQAAEYYREVAGAIRGKFVVTMEHPSTSKPDKLEITACEGGATLHKQVPSTAAVATRTRSLRAGLA